MQPIVVQTTINAPIEKVWERFTKPEHITKWAFADESWEAPTAENDLRTGGRFITRMQAKDKSAGFDFSGTYTHVVEQKKIAYTMDGDGRKVETLFEEMPEGVHVTQTFDPETENPEDVQRAGWQSILNNFKKYAES